MPWNAPLPPSLSFNAHLRSSRGPCSFTFVLGRESRQHHLPPPPPYSTLPFHFSPSFYLPTYLPLPRSYALIRADVSLDPGQILQPIRTHHSVRCIRFLRIPSSGRNRHLSDFIQFSRIHFHFISFIWSKYQSNRLLLLHFYEIFEKGVFSFLDVLRKVVA